MWWPGVRRVTVGHTSPPAAGRPPITTHPSEQNRRTRVKPCRRITRVRRFHSGRRRERPGPRTPSGAHESPAAVHDGSTATARPRLGDLWEGVVTILCLYIV